MKNSQNQIKTFWKIPDAQQEKLISLIETEQKELSDTLQSVLDQFGNTEMKGYLPRQKIERLYRAIRRWEQDGYDEGEMRLWMNDLKKRRRIRGEEAFFMFLFASMVNYNRAVAKRSLPFLTASAIAAYNHSYKMAHAVTGKGKRQEINQNFVKSSLDGTLPSGGDFYSGLENDAHYRARQVQEQAISNLIQKKPLDMNSPEFVRIMNAQKHWQLRRTHASVAGGYAGYYDMVTSFMVHTAVAQAYKDAQVKEYRFIAVIDDVTTTTCKGLNGQTFRMSDMKMGINFPPTYPPPHPCRSITEPIK